MKIAIVGAGSLGTVFGARLARAHDVTMLVRDEQTAQAIENRGGLVVGDDPPQCVVATHDARRLAGCALAIVAVKAFATIEALAPLRAIFARGTVVISIQNGIDAAAQIESALAAGAALAVGSTTEAARALEPGVAIRASIGSTTLGWATKHARNGTVLEEIAAAFSSCGLQTRTVGDVLPYLWGKLVVNAALNPITALARVTNGEFAARPGLLARGIAIAREVAALAACEGIVLPYADVADRVRAVANATASNRSSMLQDIERGRPTEIEAILGTVVRRAATFGLAVPQCVAAYDEVRRCANA